MSVSLNPSWLASEPGLRPDPTSTIRVVLVDHEVLFRTALRTLLETLEGVNVVGEASSGSEALERAHETRADVVLMELKTPGQGGVETIRRMRMRLPNCQVVALTAFEDDELVFECLRAGAVGYLLKSASPAQLICAINAAAHGQSFMQPSVLSKVVAEFSRLPRRVPAVGTDEKLLSKRELEVLHLLVQGSSNKEIAGALFLAEGTVKNRITNIFAKLSVKDRTQAALRARELGIV